MGSSRYAAVDAALRLRAAGIDAVADYASATVGWPPSADCWCWRSRPAASRPRRSPPSSGTAGGRRVVALTDAPRSTIATLADDVIPLGAGEERGGVACRSFQHTRLVLRAIEARLGGRPATTCRPCASAVGEATRDSSTAVRLAPGGRGRTRRPGRRVPARPAERLASAEQGALMIREGPRRLAVGCETGDWSHVDVYLTKTLDYRALLFAGSPWDGEALDWLAKRGSTFVAVGAERAGRAARRFATRATTTPRSRRYAEVLVPELLAATWWAQLEPS